MVKSPRFHENLSSITQSPHIGIPPVHRERWFRQYLPDTLLWRLAHHLLTLTPSSYMP